MATYIPEYYSKSYSNYKFEPLCLNFGNTTAKHEECKEVIRRRWQQDNGNRNCWNQFTRKKSRCKRELMEWSREKFKRADKEIELKKIELHQIQEADMMDRDQRRERELKN
ncbi:hypothetical protein Ahy_Scaffold6g108098 isoform B [Arachis hypogaea]|uniref:Uncharacterized protein n=1 Tax=Arachis hypogaea TaxID=3818 RepID=A0A444WPK1_ARAHY|nr:hypothetical protein Ahy_Scaffold6g108098 isoform B [Arachis hypogaea]